MARTDAIEVEGVVVEVLPNATCRVELANGHRLRAFVAGKTRLSFASLAVGTRVKLELSPYDLSEGRIVVDPPVKRGAPGEKMAETSASGALVGKH